MSAHSPPEVLLCDTSIVGHLFKLRVDPERYSHWGEEVVRRIDDAILAISIVTIAEARFGYRNRNWGRRRVEEWELRLGSFLQLPLDLPDLDEWARLRDLAERGGVAICHNDLWIAATAGTRNHPLVTCDKDQQRLGPYLPAEVVYLPPSA